MNDEHLKDQINALIRDEIQEVINDYVDEKEESKKSGLGFVSTEEETATPECDKLLCHCFWNSFDVIIYCITILKDGVQPNQD